MNDTMELVITHYRAPGPDLGGVNDSLGTSLPLTLDAGADYSSYLWNNVYGGRTYDANQYGWHTLEVSDMQGCTGRDSVFLMPFTTVEDPYLPGELMVYPVPASQFLHVEYRYQEAETLYLELFDASGRHILIRPFQNVMEVNETLDVSGMSAGFYYLRLRSEAQVLTRKISIY